MPTLLNQQNQNTLSGFPFLRDLPYPGVVVSASFVQFNGFQPKLSTIRVDTTSLTLTLLLDAGVVTTTVSTSPGADTRFSRLRAAGRYLGTLTYGPGIFELSERYAGQLLTLNESFDPDTVQSVSLDSGVFTLEGHYGQVPLGKVDLDATVFFNTSTDKNSIMLHAVTGNTPGTAPSVLRRVNLIPPRDNNIELLATDIIKFAPGYGSSLEVSLVAGSSSFKTSTLSN